MQGELRVLNRSGDEVIRWDTEVTEGRLDPAYARSEFQRLVDEGHLAFVDTTEGARKTGEMLRPSEFDPKVHERVIFSPSFVGG